MIEGGCFCKRIRYAIDEATYRAANCHCTMCRRIHAAPYVGWLIVPAGSFRYVAATPTELHSSASGTRYFCPSCGTHVACINTSHPEIVDVAVGSLDSPERFEPTIEVFTETRLPSVPPSRATDV
jgi:hypothetical protein